ncbi:TRAP transporter substrate-binding protein [Bradyrhizobium acaciae]|uniref:TRAP transporter substrate-binding protein n=1 Tax=Bradyrhizobium acaciae TaxID=2683706 RepID=UPI001E28FF51|nr:TRAP transporter substrate-binding protein [Bradyrhizobium acaciae]MCC8978932.1 TRAP transporter substrate-binding protein [Bradyrhizobium acaciae]
MMRRSFVGFICAALLCLFEQPALAQVTWQMATEYPQTNISGVGLTTFSKLISAHTNGFVTVRTSFDNELKIGSAEMIGAARDGRVTGGDAFAASLEKTDPVFGLPTLPFLVQSFEVARALNTRARPLYEKALEAQNLKLLYMTIWPATGLWSDRALNSANDLSALMVRTYDNNSAEVLQAAGAHAEYLPFSEAIPRLKDHKLNAILSSGDGGAGRKLWEDLRYFTAINYATSVSIAFVRLDAFASLSKPVQEQVMAAATETEKSQFDLIDRRTADNYARMRANGVNISDPAPLPLIAALKRAAAMPISAWKAKAPVEAVAIADWASEQKN